MKKLTALWLSLLLAFGTLTGCAGQIGIIGGADDRHHHLGQRFRCFRHRGWAVRQQGRGFRLSDRIRALTLQLHHEKAGAGTRLAGRLARAVCTRLLDRRRPVWQLRGHPAGRQLSRVRPQHPRSRQARRGTAGLRGRRPNLLHRRPLREF